MDMAVELNAEAPEKGLEFSVVRREVCRPFRYPTPYELHFSIAHLAWYSAAPEDYLKKMTGTDKDLAAHFTIVCRRGKRLCGEEIGEVFDEPDRAFYFDSIWEDVKNAEEDVAVHPAYSILNLSRVLAYAQDGLVLSKQEGGQWGLENVPAGYRPLLAGALAEYTSRVPVVWDRGGAKAYAAYMLDRIRKCRQGPWPATR